MSIFVMADNLRDAGKLTRIEGVNQRTQNERLDSLGGVFRNQSGRPLGV